MKKITILALMLFGVVGFSQNKELNATNVSVTSQPIERTATINFEGSVSTHSYSEFLPVATRTVNLSNTSATISNRGTAVVTPYSNRASFEAAYSGAFVTEDFAGGPGAGAITPCGPVVSSAGDGCFAAGELVDGFTITADSGGDVIYIGAGAIGNTSTLMGANTFLDYTEINFAPDGAYAAGMDVFASGVLNTDVRVYDMGGVLLDSFTLNNPSDTEYFVGVISDTAIGKIEIQAEADAGELFGNFEFGTDAPGGGGGSPCDTTGPSNGFENGKSFTMNLGRVVAHDITVNADEDFMLQTINLSAFIGASGSGVNAAAVDVYVYADGGGAPGAVITSELGMVPASQTVIGSNFGFDVWDVELDVTDVALAGQAGVPTKYWIGISLEPTDASNTFWENSTAGLIGSGEAYDDGLGGGFIIDNTLEGVYTIAGECSPIGGGGGNPCDTSAPGNAFENGKSFTQNLGRIVAHDVVVNADEDFTLEVINLNAFIGASGSGVNAVAVDVYIYADGGGAPGAVLASELGLVPASQTVVGSNFGFDVWDVELDITDVLLPSQAGIPTSYWIGVSLEPTDGSNTFWENSTAGLVGMGEAYDDGLGGGFIVDNTLEGVYTFSGTCGGTTGVSDNSFAGFAFYPNPTSQTLSLKSVENIDSVSLYNLLGQRVLEANVNATTTDLNVSGLSTGTYIMKVTVNGQIGTFKVLKN